MGAVSHSIILGFIVGGIADDMRPDETGMRTRRSTRAGRSCVPAGLDGDVG
jgi:hypothetical protein